MTVRIVEPHQGVDLGGGQQVTPPPHEVLFVDSRGVLVAVVFQRGDDFGSVTSVLVAQISSNSAGDSRTSWLRSCCPRTVARFRAFSHPVQPGTWRGPARQIRIKLTRSREIRMGFDQSQDDLKRFAPGPYTNPVQGSLSLKSPGGGMELGFEGLKRVQTVALGQRRVFWVSATWPPRGPGPADGGDCQRRSVERGR
ncbi:MAG: hypothetical protein CM1200mP2_16690 [Planctomycetaceae bacterium]|nr:MAG: hypothetical protein CM1200mP2_16690 [Planctomycetaceae bacterium]